MKESPVKETPVDQFMRKFSTVCSSLKESKKDNSGFYWDYYAAYFINMSENKMLEPFAYIAFASSGKPEITTWLENHQHDLAGFSDWNEKYLWK